MSELYIKNMSVSQLGTLNRDAGAWMQQYLFGEFDNSVVLSAAVGIIAHKFVEILLKSGGDENEAMNYAYNCVYDAENGNTYVIDPERMEKDVKDMTETEVLEQFRTKKIDFGKTGSKGKLLKDLRGAIEGYLSEKINYGDIEGCEVVMEHEIIETILDYKFQLPVPFKCIADQVCRLTEDRQIITPDKEVLTIPAGSLYIEDTKFKAKYSDVDMDDPKYFFQAMFNYYCVTKEYGEEPAFINFREIKTSKNRDGSSQHQLVTFLFSGEDFEINKTYFWRFLMASVKYMEFLQENDVIYNVFDFIGGAKQWKKQLAFYQNIKVDQLKTKMSVSNKSKVSGNNFSGHNFNLLDKGQKIEKSETIGIITIEDQIRTKLREYGIDMKYEKTNEGYAYNQILFTPGRGVEMTKVERKLKELQQATGLEAIRIEAPVPGTKFIGIEYPREVRQFLEFKKYKKKVRGLKLPIGNNLAGKTIEVDLTDSNYPHLLVAGTTGSGKTELLKVWINSILGKCHLILVDPKMTEFAEYEDTCEYYSDEEKVNEMLMNKFYDMKMRFEKFKLSKAKDITSYNKKQKNKMQREVIIIDEFGDLKMSMYGKDIEKNVERITNLGRAAGIHVIIATQRPDAKIINGRIRNNIATRICLKVGSQIDSNVILETSGAEQLLGKGDLLFKDGTKIQRLQSFYNPE